MTELVQIPAGSWRLNGIVHKPAKEYAAGLRVGVVLLHENINTRFGTHRLFLRLAQELAKDGFYVLRYDNRGTCDSPDICDLTFEDRVGDAQFASDFFRRSYRLDSMLLWGLCMGAAVATYCAAGSAKGKQVDGLVLCSILADPSDASLPDFGYQQVELSAVVRNSLRGDLLRKLAHAWDKLAVYRENLAKLTSALARRYLQREPGLDRLRASIARVGDLLAASETPTLLIFGEKDPYWNNFLDRVNPGDRLGLQRKRLPPAVVIIPDGDHTFSSREQTAEMIRVTLAWAGEFRSTRSSTAVTATIGAVHGISLAPASD